MHPLQLPAPVILASASPRRQALLEQLGIKFTVVVKSTDEAYPPALKKEAVAVYLAGKKAEAFDEEAAAGNIIITADTIVCLGESILNKASDSSSAFEMLKMLSGRRHDVITAVCIRYKGYSDLFHVSTAVFFKTLTDAEINWYIETCRPFDKAGAYGIQDWIGIIAIERIEGSYYNVVGLPVKEVYEHLQQISRRP